MLIKLYDKNPSERSLQRIVELLERGGVIIYPTDSCYAFGCSAHVARGVERLCRLKAKQEQEFALMFDSISTIASYCRVDNAAFKMLKRNLPGAFTFLLPASSRVPERVVARRRTIGVRIPDSGVARAIVEALGAPLITTSLPADDEEGYCIDPELIEERYGHEVDCVVDGGTGRMGQTTVVDLTSGEVEIIREGLGELA